MWRLAAVLILSNVVPRFKILCLRPLFPVRSSRQARRGGAGVLDVDELDDGAANGAILVGFEPGVDAGNVKSVVTFGHNPEVILCLEEIQADGAFRRFPQQRLRFSVLADGDGVDDGGVEPDGADSSLRIQERRLVAKNIGRAMDLRFGRAKGTTNKEDRGSARKELRAKLGGFDRARGIYRRRALIAIDDNNGPRASTKHLLLDQNKATKTIMSTVIEHTKLSIAVTVVEDGDGGTAIDGAGAAAALDAGAGEAAETGDNSASAAEEGDGPGVATGAARTGGAAGGSAAECGDGAAAKQTATEKAANSATKNNTTSLEDAIDDGRKGIELIKIVDGENVEESFGLGGEGDERWYL
nr:hypothetical protein Iba_chr14bCG0550 [Ipomoea batatas]GME00051.1 hypothetical protein Iba_scaffold55488CG0010 [Ipomoea batatas]GME15147.1 hypothetical protein Iba_scaffold15946CG0110 [Ipomoea batatas]GME19743.1 hypothetical protein Iba_scaffold23668CG0040 [Ipomoea batatas]